MDHYRQRRTPANETLDVFDDRAQRILDDNPISRFHPSTPPQPIVFDEHDDATLTREDFNTILQRCIRRAQSPHSRKDRALLGESISLPRSHP